MFVICPAKLLEEISNWLLLLNQNNNDNVVQKHGLVQYADQIYIDLIKNSLKTEQRILKFKKL